jgi:replication-associated recombination protein RarA
MSSLLSKYRPTTLAEVRGQPQVVKQLVRFAKAPYSAAMLFHGESGIGKSCCAKALAADLGVAVESAEFGGLYEIPSGEMQGQEVRAMLRQLAFRPMMGSGWKVLLCNEADRMSTSAETIWLDALENIPDKSVIAFTTNAPWKLTQRFRDRCEVYAFESDSEKLKPHIKKMAQEIWKAEVGKGKCPALDILGMPTLGDADSMHASFRLALQQLTRYVRAAQGGAEELAQEREQLVKSIGLGEGAGEATCDHCRHRQSVTLGMDRHTCAKCGQDFAVEWE